LILAADTTKKAKCPSYRLEETARDGKDQANSEKIDRRQSPKKGTCYEGGKKICAKRGRREEAASTQAGSSGGK